MKVIAIIGQKGGTGKTTLAQILSVAAERSGIVSVGIDLDPQLSWCSWSDLRSSDSPVVVDVVAGRLDRALSTAKEQGAGLVILDTAGRAQQEAVIAAKAADLVILPLQPTITDLSTVESALTILKLAGDPKAFAVLMRTKPFGSRHTDTAEWLEGQGITVCPHTIGDRVSFQDAAATGQTPQETDSRSKAAAECNSVYMYTRKKVGV